MVSINLSVHSTSCLGPSPALSKISSLVTASGFVCHSIAEISWGVPGPPQAVMTKVPADTAWRLSCIALGFLAEIIIINSQNFPQTQFRFWFLCLLGEYKQFMLCLPGRLHRWAETPLLASERVVKCNSMLLCSDASVQHGLSSG